MRYVVCDRFFRLFAGALDPDFDQFAPILLLPVLKRPPGPGAEIKDEANLIQPEGRLGKQGTILENAISPEEHSNHMAAYNTLKRASFSLATWV